eukprot:UN5048
MLGLYKSRDKDYVNVPTSQMHDDDVLHVEYIFAPHFDVDGSPNFYWFEGIIPSSILHRLYVPLMTCFYSSLRRLATSERARTEPVRHRSRRQLPTLQGVSSCKRGVRPAFAMGCTRTV